MKFLREHLQTFAEISGDANPLHLDFLYARQTQFGEQLFHGVGAVLACLGSWARGRPFIIDSIQVVFKKPILLGEEYDLEINEREVTTISLKQGRTLILKIDIVSKWVLSFFSYVPNQPKFEKISPQFSFADQDFETNWDSFLYCALPPDPNFEKYFSLKLGQLPQHQWNAILGSSYWVGMAFPGRQALFSRIALRFAPDEKSDHFPCFSEMKLEDRSLFRLTTTLGRGRGILSFQIEAFVRPESVQYSIDDIQAKTENSKFWKGKRVLISGGTRGLGSVLARMLLIQRASVITTFHSNDRNALQLKEECSQKGLKLEVFQKDQWDTALSGCGKEIDFLISNASPPIYAEKFLDQSMERFDRFFFSSNQSPFRFLALGSPCAFKGSYGANHIFDLH